MNLGIYIIKNILTGKYYVGSSTDINRRLRDHKNCLKKNKHHSIKLQRAWNKYGSASFIFESIQYCNREDLKSNEQYWIDHFDSYKKGYNCTLIAGSQLGRIWTEESKQKLSNSRKGQRNSQETEFKKGNIPWNNEIKGVHFSPETEFKKGQIGYWAGKKRIFTEEHKKKSGSGSITIIIDNIEYYSIKESARKLNICESTIRYRLNSDNFINYIFKNE